MDVTGDFLYRDEMDSAERAAREAGAIVMGMFKGKYDVHEKSKNNPVTTADLEANRTIREILQFKFSADGWLSEEDYDTSRRLSLSRVWVVDPIDGTKEFIEGVPQFAISIGFVVDGRPKVGVVYNPAEQRLYKAAAGQGAYLNDQPIRVTARTEIDGAVLLVSRSEPQRKFKVFIDRCDIKPVGSIAFRLAKIAAGDGDSTLTLRSIREWDICAGAMIVQEAGGVIVNGKGETMTFNQSECRFRGVVAANPSLVWGLQALLAEALAQQEQRR